MRFFSSREVAGFGIQEDGDRLAVAILLIRDRARPGRHEVYLDGDVSRPLVLMVNQGAGQHYRQSLRRLDG